MANHILGTSHYLVLGVPSDASLADIKRAYKGKLLNTHPDKTNGEVLRNKSHTINRIQEAYKVLSNPNSRQIYDKELEGVQKSHGFYNHGDGLDEFSLDEFDFNEESLFYFMDCPRCKTKEGIQISENSLEEYVNENASSENSFLVLIQCVSCSMWVKVAFALGEEE